MRILLDACMSGRSKRELLDSGHQVEWAGDWPVDPGDEEILARAAREGRVLVTLDRDFGELAIRQGQRHTGIVRLVNVPVLDQGLLITKVLAQHASDLAAGAILTVSPDHTRIRTRGGGA